MTEIVPSVKNPKLRDMMGIFGMFNEEKDKKSNSDLLLQMKLSTKTCSSWCGAVAGFLIFLERERVPSL